MRVYFIDTSVLDNLLAIPHKCQAQEQSKIDFAERQSENAKFILPIKRAGGRAPTAAPRSGA